MKKEKIEIHYQCHQTKIIKMKLIKKVKKLH